MFFLVGLGIAEDVDVDFLEVVVRREEDECEDEVAFDDVNVIIDDVDIVVVVDEIDEDIIFVDSIKEDVVEIGIFSIDDGEIFAEAGLTNSY